MNVSQALVANLALVATPSDRSRYGCARRSATAHGMADALRRQTSWNQLTDESLGRVSSAAAQYGKGLISISELEGASGSLKGRSTISPSSSACNRARPAANGADSVPTNVLAITDSDSRRLLRSTSRVEGMSTSEPPYDVPHARAPAARATATWGGRLDLACRCRKWTRTPASKHSRHARCYLLALRRAWICWRSSFFRVPLPSLASVSTANTVSSPSAP